MQNRDVAELRGVLVDFYALTGITDDIDLEIERVQGKNSVRVTFRQLIDGAPLIRSSSLTADLSGEIKQLRTVLTNPNAAARSADIGILADEARTLARNALATSLGIAEHLIAEDSEQPALLQYDVDARDYSVRPVWLVPLANHKPMSGFYRVYVDAISGSTRVVSIVSKGTSC